MKRLITNIRGSLGLEALLQTQADEVIFIQTSDDQETELDKIMEVRYELVRSDSLNLLTEDLLRVLTENRGLGDTYLALEPDKDEVAVIGYFLGSVLKVKMFCLALNKGLCPLPQLQLNITETKERIIKILNNRPYTSTDLAEELGITRPMVYNHINHLRNQSLVRRDKSSGILSLTGAGELLGVVLEYRENDPLYYWPEV